MCPLNAAPQARLKAGARHERRLEAVACRPVIMYEAPQHTLWYAIVENGNEERRSPQAYASLLSIR